MTSMPPFPFPLRPSESPAEADDAALKEFTRLGRPAATGAACTGGSKALEGHVLPLAAFKWCPERIAWRRPVTTEFASSGTTGALRSRSGFSEEGLADYRNSATAHFRDVIAALAKKSSDDIGSLRLISLIPPITESGRSDEGLGGAIYPGGAAEVWAQSSLAYMVATFGVHWPLTYVTADTFKEAYEKDQSAHPDCPAVVLGTALHWLAVMDDGLACTLNSTTWLLETGGLKGQYQPAQNLEQQGRGWFYERLRDAFGIAETQIISEYGSCELAAQAYDYVVDDRCERAEGKNQERRFRFAPHITVAVGHEDADGTLSAQRPTAVPMTGTMLIYDPHRSDAPYLIETEDRIELSSDSSFRLLGRIQTAPIKGCSLLAESLPQATQSQQTASTAPTWPASPSPWPTLGARIAAMRSMWQELLSDESWLGALTTDLYQLKGHELTAWGLKNVTESALADLAGSFLAPQEDYLRAIVQITGKPCRGADPASGREGEKWLMVLPSSHPLAGLYPLTVAALLGLRVGIRASSRRSFRSLTQFIGKLRDFSFVRMNVVEGDAAYSSHLGHAGGLMAFGQDATIALFRQRFAGRCSTFGDAVCGTVVAGAPTAEAVAAVVKDIVSLGGLGCLSSRFVLVVSPEPEDALNWGHQLAAALRPYGVPDLSPTGQRSARAPFILQGYHPLQQAGTPLWSVMVKQAGADAEGLGLPPSEGIIPVRGIRSVSDLSQALAAITGLKRLALPKTLSKGSLQGVAGIELCPLGELNRNPMTGAHLGQVLF